MVKSTAILLLVSIACQSAKAFTPYFPTTPTLVNPATTKIAKFYTNVASSSSSDRRSSFSTSTYLNASAGSASDNESNKQGLSASTFSLVKAIVGSGVLALPGKVFWRHNMI